MTNYKPSHDAEQWFNIMQEQLPEPSPIRQSVARQAFLTQARLLRQAHVRPRFKHGWLWNQNRGAYQMSTLLKIILAFSLLAGGTTGTALAADASVPGDPLYAMDQWMEQTQMQLAGSPEAQAKLQAQLAAERGSELNKMARKGQPIDPEDIARLELQIQKALQLASQLEEPQMLALLNQIQLMLQEQAGQLFQYQEKNGAAVMEQYKNEAQNGIDDPAGFQEKHRAGAGWEESDGDDESDGAGNGAGNGNSTGNGQNSGQTCPAGEDCAGDQDQQQDQTQERKRDQDCNQDATDCNQDQTRDREGSGSGQNGNGEPGGNGNGNQGGKNSGD